MAPECACLVTSLLLRAAYGGMAGDVAMLRRYARIWLHRFPQPNGRFLVGFKGGSYPVKWCRSLGELDKACLLCCRFQGGSTPPPLLQAPGLPRLTTAHSWTWPAFLEEQFKLPGVTQSSGTTHQTL